MTENHSFGCIEDQMAMGLHDFGLGKSQMYQKPKEVTKELKKKAENFIIDRYKLNECYRDDNEETRAYMRMDVHLQYEEEYQLYLAGATENSVQWHDLRKDPNDVPKRNGNVVQNQDGDKVTYDYRQKQWRWTDGGTDGLKMIAWCEVPRLEVK